MVKAQSAVSTECIAFTSSWGQKILIQTITSREPIQSLLSNLEPVSPCQCPSETDKQFKAKTIGFWLKWNVTTQRKKDETLRWPWTARGWTARVYLYTGLGCFVCFSINIVNAFSLPYDFYNNILFSLASFIVRIRCVIYITYKICVNRVYVRLFQK